MKTMLRIIPFAAGAVLAPLLAQSPAAPAASTATTLPPEVQAALDRAKAQMASQPPAGGARGNTVAVPPMPNLIASTKGPDNLTIGLSNLTESRSATGSGTLNLGIVVAGGNLPPGSSLRRATIKNALDDKDRSLVSNNARGGLAVISQGMSALMNANSRLMAVARGGTAAATMAASAQLAVSRRDALAIKVLEGELEIFAPSAGTGSILAFKDVMTLVGKPLEHPALAREGIELMLVNAESYGAIRDRFLNPAAVAAGVTQPDPTFANGPAVYVRDPAGKLAAYIFQDAAGNPVLAQNTSSRLASDGSSMLSEARFVNGVPPNAQLVVYLALPEAVQVVPFRLENVALP
jgi:hypothetical protein